MRYEREREKERETVDKLQAVTPRTGRLFFPFSRQGGASAQTQGQGEGGGEAVRYRPELERERGEAIFKMRPVDRVVFKGKTTPTTLYEVTPSRTQVYPPPSPGATLAWITKKGVCVCVRVCVRVLVQREERGSWG